MNKEDFANIIGICSDHGWTELTRVGKVYLASYDPVMEKLPQELEKTVEDSWNEKTRKSREQGNPEPFSERFGRYLGHRVDPDGDLVKKVGINLGVTDYRQYVGVKGNQDYRIFSLGSSSHMFFRDKNGEIIHVFGARTRKVADLSGDIENRPSGYLSLDSKDVSNGDEIFEEQLKEEFEEEVGLNREKIVRIQPLSLMIASDCYNRVLGRSVRYNDVTVNFSLEVDATEEELREALSDLKKNGNQENRKQFFVHNDWLLTFLTENERRLVPRLRANLKHFLLYFNGVSLLQ